MIHKASRSFLVANSGYIIPAQAGGRHKCQYTKRLPPAGRSHGMQSFTKGDFTMQMRGSLLLLPSLPREKSVKPYVS